jgi:predicted hydrocarbon binding protein
MNVIKKTLFKAVFTRSSPMLNMLSGEVGALGKTFYNKYGKESLPMIAGVVSQSGVEWGKIMRNNSPTKGMQAAGELQRIIGDSLGWGVDLVEATDEKLHFKVSKCPFGIEGTSKELCEAMMIMDETRMSTFLGQEVEVRILKSVAAGDKQCEVIFSKK